MKTRRRVDVECASAQNGPGSHPVADRHPRNGTVKLDAEVTVELRRLLSEALVSDYLIQSKGDQCGDGASAQRQACRPSPQRRSYSNRG